jgi:hypothetical protein
MLVSRQESILNRVFRVVRVTHIAKGSTVKPGQMVRNGVFKLSQIPFANPDGRVLLDSAVRLLCLHVVDTLAARLNARRLPIFRT